MKKSKSDRSTGVGKIPPPGGSSNEPPKKFILCEYCGNACSPYAELCPKCGHPFDEMSPERLLAILEYETNSSVIDEEQLSTTDLLNTAIDYMESGDYQGAIGYCVKALKTNPHLVQTWYILGTLYTRAENDQRAEQCFGIVFRIDPQFAKRMIEESVQSLLDSVNKDQSKKSR